MFGKSRKNALPADDGNLIYADTQSGEAVRPAVRRHRGLVTLAVTLMVVALAVMAATAMQYRFREKQERYDLAQALLRDREYEAAMAGFEALGNYRDSQDRAAQLARQRADYDTAVELVAQQRYDEAREQYRICRRQRVLRVGVGH